METPGLVLANLKKQKNFTELMNEHHLLGIFYQFFNDSQLPVECQHQYKRQWVHNNIVLEELELISLEAGRFDSQATLLKGAHLLLDLYTDLGSRSLSDIDLLIAPAEMARWEKILLACGFTIRSEEKFQGNNFKQDWVKRRDNLEINIELHTKLFFHLKNENWNISKTPYSNLNKLKNEDLLIHLCGHLAFQHSFLKLYWLFDLYFFIMKFQHEINWNELYLKSKANHLYRSVQMCLRVLSSYFGIKFDEKIIHLFELEKKQWWKKYLTLDFLINPLANRMQYLIIKHATKDHLITALYYDLTWFYHYKVQKLWLKQKV